MKGWLVVWGDAHLNALDEAEAADTIHRPWRYTTLGILVKTDNAGVTVAMDQGEDGKYRTRTFIPRSMVIEEREIPLKVPRKRKEKKRAKSGDSQAVPPGDVQGVDGPDREEGR